MGGRQLHTQNLFTLVKKICERLKSICGYNSTGGDLVFFIEGLQKAVNEVKKTVGEGSTMRSLKGLAQQFDHISHISLSLLDKFFFACHSFFFLLQI